MSMTYSQMAVGGMCTHTEHIHGILYILNAFGIIKVWEEGPLLNNSGIVH